ncbi:MAG: homing endonuclease associated repeat-containing protein [Chlamydiota bacterium]
MKFELEPFHRDTPDSELIIDIQHVAETLNKKTVTIAEYELHGKYHPSTLQRRFGSWFNVLEKAGLEDSRSRLNNSEEDLFKNIEEIWIKLGRQPKYNEVKKPFSKFSAGTYDQRFGSWRKALEAFIQYINSDTGNDTEISEVTDESLAVDKNNEIHIKHKTKREISVSMRFKILMRDGFTCKKCGRSPVKELDVELHVDHIVPWSKGGETIPENLETKCKKCNLGKGNAFEV